MTQLNILVISLKVAAIFLLLEILQSVPEAFFGGLALEDGIDSSTLFILIGGPALVKLAVALLFWFVPKTIITSVIPDVENSQENTSQLTSLYKALIPAIGVYLVAIALSDLAYFMSLKNEMQNQFGSKLQPSDKAGYVASVVQIIIGIALILGSNFLNRFLSKVRV